MKDDGKYVEYEEYGEGSPFRSFTLLMWCEVEEISFHLLQESVSNVYVCSLEGVCRTQNQNYLLGNNNKRTNLVFFYSDDSMNSCRQWKGLE